jgi:hypothetical protein
MKILLIFILIVSFAFGIIIDCKYSAQYYLFVSNLYECHVTSIVDGNSTMLEQVQGKHKIRKSNDDVEAFYVKNQKLQRFEGIEKFFPNLKAINLYNTSLQTLSAVDLKAFSRLMYFGSWENTLVTIPGNLFQFTQSLRCVSFYNNSIESVGSDLLKNLEELQYVDFQYNSCGNGDASSKEAISQMKERLNKCKSFNDSK